MISEPHPASFRDRAGYVVKSKDKVYRVITRYGIEDYRSLVDSGLYEKLTSEGLLVGHQEVDSGGEDAESLTLLPEQLSPITYPYEWCFSELKDAALAVLRTQELALAHGMSLKDATAYNVQFAKGKPLLIDTSSFEEYREGEPWIAYRQFCEHFLCPLVLISRVDYRLAALQRSYIDGIPVDIAASLAPRTTWLNPWLYMHVRMHGKSKRRAAQGASVEARMPKSALLGLIASLRKAVESLEWEMPESTWGDYSSSTSYDDASSKEKHRLVREYLAQVEPRPGLVWDLGANAGEFSRIASDSGISTVAWDGDPVATERNYRAIKTHGEQNLLPLIQDFANPSPGLGWEGVERASFLDRGPADVAFALALIHHIAIGNSVPMARAATFFAKTGRWLIIEFVDPEDVRVRELLQSRTDSHPYDQSTFENAFRNEFDILRSDAIMGSQRRLYLMRRKP